MSSIRTGIELQDNFSSILYTIISSVNLAVSSMEEMQQTMNADIDTSSLSAVRDKVNQATIAVNELNNAMESTRTPNTPSTPVKVEDATATIQVPVAPIVPDPLIENPPSVLVPIEWETDRLDVFSGTGIDRFRQEVQSANSMLEQLSNTQDSIAKQAYNTNIFPPEAFQNLNSLAVRIDTVRRRIQQIENNPINIGTSSANTELERLRSQLNQALQEQNHLNSAMHNMDVSAANQAYVKLSQTIGNTEKYIRDNVTEQGRFNQEISEGKTEANGLTSTIRGAITVYALLRGLGASINISDSMAQTTARLNMMNDGLQSTQDLQNMIYLSAERSRGSYQGTVNTVAKLGTTARDAFSSSNEIISFAEQLNKQFTISGTGADEMKNATIQLTQALGSGVLRGDELNSIFEQAPTIIQSIADYLNVPIGKIREMAADGKISAAIVKNAMFAAADETNAKFESMPKTFEQVGQSIQNTALMAFQPVLERLNDTANSEAFSNFANSAVNNLAVIANIVLNIFDLIGAVGGFIVDNWSMISPVIYGVAAALGIYYGWLLLTKIAAFGSAAAQWALNLAKMLAVPIYAAATGATMAETAAQWGLNSALYACPIVWIIILIIALIAIFYAAVAAINHFAGTSYSATGVIAGAFVWLMALIGNIVIGTINSLIQFMWSNFVEPFIGIFEWVLNVVNGGFDSFGGAVANLIGQIISWFLSLGKVITKIVDAIFGTNWTSGLSSLQDSVLAWGKNDNAITLDRNAPEIDYRFDMTDAYDTGYKFGKGIDEKISDFNPADLFGATDIPKQEDYANALDSSTNLSNISNNTKGIKDSIDITEEDLKYLRDIAEQETINRFTTAEVTINQTNHNNISSEMDLDGVVNHFAVGVNEAMDKAAEGVHV